VRRDEAVIRAYSAGVPPFPDMLEFRAVDTHYGDLQVLKSVNYTIMAGEIVCLLSGNASGKSTTMRAVIESVFPTSCAPVLEARRSSPA
jgi:ABC-type branched-subunit amino acid transport system ATPase component